MFRFLCKELQIYRLELASILQIYYLKKKNLLNARFFANDGSIVRTAMKKPLSALLAASQMIDIATSADWSSDRIFSNGSMSTLKTLSGA